MKISEREKKRVETRRWRKHGVVLKVNDRGKVERRD